METVLSPKSCLFLLILSALLPASGLRAAPATWLPVNGVVPASGFVVDSTNRLEALAFYNTVYLASEGAESRMGWTGAFDGRCQAGTTSSEFREDIRRRVNYYRAVCGLPADITFDAEPAVNNAPAGKPTVSGTTTKKQCVQAAALLHSFSNLFFDDYNLSHDPSSSPDRTVCYSSQAWNGSWNSNLALGYFGPRAIDYYILDDDGDGQHVSNAPVGHRRWILYSRSRDMSSGDVPPGKYSDGTDTYSVLPSNALYVTGQMKDETSAPKQFVTWPPRGYLPRPLLPTRWSISYPGAVFPAGAAFITITGPRGEVLPVTVLSANEPNLGDNTLVFQPQNLPQMASGDSTYTVTIAGISGNGAPAVHSWQTILFDPVELGVTQSVTGPVQPPVSGAEYSFTSTPHTQDYQVLVSQPLPPQDFVENGESATPGLRISKSGAYPLLQGPATSDGLGFTPRGSRSIHLTFPPEEAEPDFEQHPQSITLGPEFIPSAGSTVSFHEHFRWVLTYSRLSLEISTDGGSVWKELYGRSGQYVYPAPSYASTLWDTTWHLRTVPLAEFAGRPVQLRFIFRPGRVAFDQETIHHGIYLDDITVSGVRHIPSRENLTLQETAFALNTQSAGAPLQPGSDYLLRVRPRIGSRAMGYSSPLTVVPAPPTGFESTWPALAAQPQADADSDGLSNLLEYALGLNPVAPDSVSASPLPVLTSAGLSLRLTVPDHVKDLDYTAETTADLIQWVPVPNSGTNRQPFFTIPVVPGENRFIRLRVSQQPPPLAVPAPLLLATRQPDYPPA